MDDVSDDPEMFERSVGMMLTVAEKEFTQTMGDFVKRMGLPHLAGELYGALMVAEPACQTEEELALMLEWPVEDVHRAAGWLIGVAVVERHRLPNRPDGCLCVRSVPELLHDRIARMREIEGILGRMLEGLAEDKVDAKERISAVIRFYESMQEAVKPWVTPLVVEEASAPVGKKLV
jgi:hypothetical protein